VRYIVSALFLTVVFGLLGSVRGEELPQFSPRELVVQADTVVRAAALEEFAPKRFRVLEVLRGTGLRVGDTLAFDDLAPHDLQIHEENLPPGQKPRLRRIAQALLFLAPPDDKGPQRRWRPALSGLRFWTEDGLVLVPEQLRNPGPYFMTVRPEADWDALVRQSRQDCLEFGRLMTLKGEGRPGPRCRALLGWVERHRAEFGSATNGWGHLEQDVFQWVLAAGGAEECWEAVRLYAELNRGAALPLRTPAFARSGGRERLLGVVVSEASLEGDRLRALTLLADRQTLWPETSLLPGRTLTEKEQTELIDCLVPLLKSQIPELRAAAARALHAASAPRDGALRQRETKRALPALVAAYRAERPGQARDDLAAAVHEIGGAEDWQGLTGNPRGLFGRLHDFGHRDGKLSFCLHLDTAGLSVYECPTYALERLDGAKVAETKTELLPVANLARSWNDGWDGSPYLLAEFALPALTPGTWRITVRGTAGKGKDKVKWAAEPRTFAVKPPMNGQGPAVISTDW
jgi:hypothetical protein